MRPWVLLALASCQSVLGISDPVLADAGADTMEAAPACAAATCSGACVDRTTDSRHCGACGRSCEGATCADGACSPLVLADENQGITCVLAVAGNVFFGVADDVYAIPRDLSGPKQWVAKTSRCNQLDWDGSTLVVRTDAGLLRMRPDGSDIETLFTGKNVRAMHGHKGEVWWLQRHIGVFHMPRAGGATVGPVNVSPADNGSQLLAVIEPYVYFGDDTADIVVRQPVTGPPPSDIVANPTSLVDGVLGEDGVIWFTDGSTLRTYREGDGGPQVDTVATGIVTYARDLVIAGNDVYVASVDGNFGDADTILYRYDRTAKQLSSFVPAVRYATALATDERYLYFTRLIGGKGSSHRELVRVSR